MTIRKRLSMREEIPGRVCALFFLTGVVLGGSACYNPRLPDCAVSCGPGGACPSAMICDNGYCGHRLGLCPSAPRDGSMDGDASGEHPGATAAGDASDGAGERPDATAADAAPPGAMGTDAGRDATGAGAPDAGTDGGSPVTCPSRHSLNLVRHVCVLDHDLNGDGKADLMAVNLGGINALISTGSSFEFHAWLDQQFRGFGGAYAADVTGLGYSDGVVFDGTTVYAIGSGPTGFGSIAANFSTWLPTPFLGDIATTVVDVNGDGRADAINFDDHAIWVALSTGTRFEDPVQWLAGDLTQYVQVFAADVNGDGMFDVVYLGATLVEVSLSTGVSFAPPVVWDESPLSSDRLTLFADFNGDGRTDAAQINNDAIWVSLSTGREFARATPWYVNTLYGSRDTIMADANGDGMADVIVVDAAKVIVALSTGSSFAAPTVWYNGTFDADLNIGVAPEPGGSFVPGIPPSP
jgi:hypothetical protein